MSGIIVIGRLKNYYYKGILAKADPGLHWQVAAILEKNLPPPARVLDLGAGQGAMSLRLFDSGYDVVAADKDEQQFNPKQLVFCKIDFDNPNEIELLVEKYKEHFDAVLGIEVIEHVENQWQYIRLLKKLIKPGGLMLITTPNISSWLSRFIFFLTGRYFHFEDEALAYGHISPLSAWEIQHILKTEDFTNIEIKSGPALPWLWVTRKLIITLAYMLKPFYILFLQGITKGDILIIKAQKC